MTVGSHGKKRIIHKRLKKKVVLVVTDDNELSENDIYIDFRLNREEMAVRIVKSKLTGKSLELVVKRYMKENHIFITRGDQVLYLLKRKGKEAYDR